MCCHFVWKWFAVNFKKQTPVFPSPGTRNKHLQHLTLVSFVNLHLDKAKTCVQIYTCLFRLALPKWQGCKSLFISISIITIYILLWHRRRDQHARYSPRHTELPTRSCFLGAMSAGNEVCVSVVCLLPKSPRPITGFRSDCVAAIISSRSGPDCQLNTQFAVVNLHHLWLLVCVRLLVYTHTGCGCVYECARSHKWSFLCPFDKDLI